MKFKTFIKIYYSHRLTKANFFKKTYIKLVLPFIYLLNKFYYPKIKNLDLFALKHEHLFLKDLNFLFQFFNSDKGDFYINQYQKPAKKEKKLTDEINFIKDELKSFNIKPNFNENTELGENLKNLIKQLEQIKIQNIINDQSKNIIKDTKVDNFILRYQVLDEFPSKELRNIVDRGKKEIKDAMERIYALFHDANFAVSGADMVVSQVRNVLTLVESDGITRHGVLTLSVIVYDN